MMGVMGRVSPGGKRSLCHPPQPHSCVPPPALRPAVPAAPSIYVVWGVYVVWDKRCELHNKGFFCNPPTRGAPAQTGRGGARKAGRDEWARPGGAVPRLSPPHFRCHGGRRAASAGSGCGRGAGVGAARRR